MSGTNARLTDLPAAGALAGDELMYIVQGDNSRKVDLSTVSARIHVATRSALKALDTTRDTVALLTEDGREGIFGWTTGDFSTQIAADTAEGVYVKADAIAATVGAWVRVQNGTFYSEWFGAKGDNTQNDGPIINIALAVLGSRGGVLKMEAKEYLVNATTIAMPNGVRLEGVYGDLESLGSVINLTGGSKIDMGGSRGTDLAYLRIQSDSTTVPAIDFDDEDNTSSYPSFDRLMVVGGREAIRFNNVLEARVTKCRLLTIAGSTRVVYFDGSNGDVGANAGIDAIEFVQCTFGSPAEATANILDLNGDVASCKFTNCVVLFGAKGMVGRRVGGGTTRDPRFVYFAGGGFENNAGPCVDFANGSLIKFSNFYASNDAAAGVSGDIFRLGSGGDFIIQGGEIRGAARDGIRVFGGSNATISGCHIGNNGRAETGHGVVITAAGKVVLGSNNIGAFSDGSNAQLYAVNLTGQVNPVVITGNNLEDNATGAITGAVPSGSKIEGNVGYDGITGTATFNPASLADGAGETTTVTVTDAALGDFAEVSFSLALQGILMTGWVSAADTVSVRFQNETGGTIDLGSGTINARVTK